MQEKYEFEREIPSAYCFSAVTSFPRGLNGLSKHSIRWNNYEKGIFRSREPLKYDVTGVA